MRLMLSCSGINESSGAGIGKRPTLTLITISQTQAALSNGSLPPAAIVRCAGPLSFGSSVTNHKKAWVSSSSRGMNYT